MQYDLSKNERFFLNQLIPKWETGQSFDLGRDLKYVFHREMGTNYNPDIFENMLETLRAFISDHGFAKENPAKLYTFNLLPKGNMLASVGSIDDFETHMKRERAGGKAIVIPDHVKTRYQAQPFLSDQYDNNPQKSRGTLLKVILALAVLTVIGMIIVRLINSQQ